jgi:hypothetical protein
MTNDENDKPEQDSAAEETPKTWEMPEPVFRTSEGTKYCRPEIEEDEEDLHETHEQIPSSQAKSSKMPFLLGGAFFVFFIATAFLAGIWFLFLKDIEPPKILTPELEKATPTPTIAPIENPTVPPGEIPTESPAVNSGENPAPTATPTPAPGGAPANV